MVDQAEKLRRLMTEKKKSIKERKKKARVISVTSGKGGVGKTNFSINFAISLQNLGYEVLVFDADIGLANVEIISGITIKRTIADLLENGGDIFDIVAEGPEGIRIISGGSGLKELNLINEKSLIEVIAYLERLESYFDFIIIDTGAGISDVVVDFLMASDEVILIVTPDPTSITDSYAMLKALIARGYIGETKVMMNMVEGKREAIDTYTKLERASKEFLNIDIKLLGYLKRSKLVNDAVKKQLPFLMSRPNSLLSKEIKAIASNYQGAPRRSDKRFSFTQKLKDLFKRRWFT